MSDATIKKIIKITIDVMSVIFLSYLTIVPIFIIVLYKSGNDNFNYRRLGLLSIADLFPAIFGVVWLCFRYGPFLSERFPSVKSGVFASRTLMVMGVLLIVLVAIKHLR